MFLNLLTTFGDNIKTSFLIKLPNAQEITIGERYGSPEFQVIINNDKGLQALKSGKELKLCEAYMDCHIDLVGKVDMLKLLEITRLFSKKHPFFTAWSKLIYMFHDQVFINRKSIAKHYELDDDFYLYFLDKTRAYSHGIFLSDDEKLDVANLRKLDFAKNSCQLSPGAKVLDIGAGWGCSVEYLGQKDVRVDSITISDHSARFVSNIIERNKLSDCRVFKVDFFDYKPTTNEPYDAIFSLGTLEHLPNYPAVISKCSSLLKEGGYAYFDASARASKHFINSQFIDKHIFPGNHQCLDIFRFLEAVQHSEFELVSLHNDTHNYFLTLKAWANNLEGHRDDILQRWGESLYRKFQLYFWGCCYGMAHNDLQAYRVVLRKKYKR